MGIECSGLRFLSRGGILFGRRTGFLRWGEEMIADCFAPIWYKGNRSANKKVGLLVACDITSNDRAAQEIHAIFSAMNR